jgi:hypothetical protein
MATVLWIGLGWLVGSLVVAWGWSRLARRLREEPHPLRRGSDPDD